ncbi:MAG: hypothetical protein KC474_10545 [Cyanobacteria bacterium HKST-UBA04]|nr:hypothetical protein [Cyanobacteria bacterium HKST-UBA04]
MPTTSYGSFGSLGNSFGSSFGGGLGSLGGGYSSFGGLGGLGGGYSSFGTSGFGNSFGGGFGGGFDTSGLIAKDLVNQLISNNSQTQISSGFNQIFAQDQARLQAQQAQLAAQSQFLGGYNPLMGGGNAINPLLMMNPNMMMGGLGGADFMQQMMLSMGGGTGLPFGLPGASPVAGINTPEPIGAAGGSAPAIVSNASNFNFNQADVNELYAIFQEAQI